MKRLLLFLALLPSLAIALETNVAIATGNWTNTTSWSLGHAPTNGEIAWLTNTAVTITVNSANCRTDAVVVDAGVLTRSAGTLTVLDVVQNGGTLSGAGGVIISNSFTKTGGYMSMYTTFAGTNANDFYLVNAGTQLTLAKTNAFSDFSRAAKLYVMASANVSYLSCTATNSDGIFTLSNSGSLYITNSTVYLNRQNSGASFTLGTVSTVTLVGSSLRSSGFSASTGTLTLSGGSSLWCENNNATPFTLGTLALVMDADSTLVSGGALAGSATLSYSGGTIPSLVLTNNSHGIGTALTVSNLTSFGNNTANGHRLLAVTLTTLSNATWFGQYDFSNSTVVVTGDWTQDITVTNTTATAFYGRGATFRGVSQFPALALDTGGTVNSIGTNNVTVQGQFVAVGTPGSRVTASIGGVLNIQSNAQNYVAFTDWTGGSVSNKPVPMAQSWAPNSAHGMRDVRRASAGGL